MVTPLDGDLGAWRVPENNVAIGTALQQYSKTQDIMRPYYQANQPSLVGNGHVSIPWEGLN
ncbi:hypothetical protein GB937_010468 [Aspergillus fischeri]|nr:hypothetical protein GB937_010468 [Aspergillus fischeri]